MASILDPHGVGPQAVPTSGEPTNPFLGSGSPGYASATDELQDQDKQYNWVSDLGHQVAGGTGDMGASLSSAVGWLAGSLNGLNPSVTPALASLANTMDDWRKASNSWAEGQGDAVSPTDRAIMSQSFFSGVTSDPMRYLAGHIAGMAPALVTTIAATALTGGIADVIAGAGAATAASTATGFGLWGTLSAGDVVNQINTAVDNVPDAKLRSTNPVYDGYRDTMSESAARTKYSRDIAGVAPAVAFTIGGLAGVFGGPGQLARAFGGDVAGAMVHDGGLVSRTLAGAAVGGTVGAAQSGGTNALTQDALSRNKLATFDTGALVEAALSGGGLGTVLGGIAEGPLASTGKLFKKSPTASLEVTPPETGALDAATTAAITPKEELIAPIPSVPEAQAVAPAPEPVAETPVPAPATAAAPVEAPVAPVPVKAPEPSAPAPEAATVPETGAEPITPSPTVIPPEVTPATPPRAPYVTDAGHKATFASVTGKSNPKAESAIKAIASGLGVGVKEVRDQLRTSTKGLPADQIPPVIYDQLRRVVEDQKVNGVEAKPKAGHRTADEIQERKDANTTASEIAAAHPPRPEVENDAMAPAKGGKGVVTSVKARNALAERVQAMAENAKDLGLPNSIENNAAADRGLNPHAMLMIEAKNLSRMIRAGKATAKDFGRFITNEHLLRSGKVDEYLQTRRAEGEAAMKPKGSAGVDNIAAPTTIEGGTSTEKVGDQVVTKVAASKSRGIKAFDEETAAKVTTAPRKVELSDDEKKALGARMTEKAKAVVDKAKAEPVTAPEGKSNVVEKVSSTERLIDRIAAKKNPGNPTAAKNMAATIRARAAEKLALKSTAKRVAEAAKETDRAPTEAQKVAGNYEKGHVRLQGLDITIENPRGSERSGVDKDGTKWSVKMPDHYGYIKRTEGADGDHVDVYIGKHPDSDHVFVIDQNKTGTEQFDEHKVMLGYDNAAQAMEAYQAAFSDGRAGERFGGLKPMSMDEFKTWLKEGDTTRPSDESTLAAKELAKDRGPKLEKLGGVTREGNATPYVQAHNSLVEWLNGLSDKDFVALQEKWGDSLKEEVDATDLPEDVAKLRGELEAMHDGKSDVFGASNKEVPEGWGSHEPGPKEVTTEPKPVDLNTLVPETKAKAEKILARMQAAASRTTTVAELLKTSDHQARTMFDRLTTNDMLKATKGTVTSDPTILERDRGIRLQRALAPNVITRITKLAGDTKVLIIPDEKYTEATGARGTVKGTYYGYMHTIVIRESALDTPHVALHEAAHAAFKTALDNNPHLTSVVKDMMVYAQEEGIELAGGSYSLTNPHEFIAEAMSNPKVQNFLGSTRAPPHVVNALGLMKAAHSMWDALVSIARQAFGLPVSSGTLLHAIFRVAHELDKDIKATEPLGRARGMNDRELLRVGIEHNRSLASRMADENSHFDVADAATKAVDSLRSAAEEGVARVTGKDRIDTGMTPKMMGLRTMDQIAQAAKVLHTFTGEPVRKAFNALQRIAATARTIENKWAPDLAKLQELMAKYRGPVADEFSSLMHDSTIAGVWPNKPLADKANKHISGQGYTDTWARAAHADLSARFDKLPDELKQAYEAQAAHFSGAQDAAAMATTQNRILTALGVKDPALAQRILSGTHTPADELALGDTFEAVKKAGVLSTANGPYFPLMRHGDYVVRGEHAVADPKAASYIGRQDKNYVFTDKDEASQFATLDEKGNTRTLKPTIDSKWVDKNTSSIWGVDPVTGEKTRITEKDVDAQKRYYVRIQNQHTEFAKSKDEARKLGDSLQKNGLLNVDVQPREQMTNRPGSSFMSHDLTNVMKQIERGDDYQRMTPTEQQSVKDAVDHLAVRLLGENRVQSRALPRRGVAGASRDAVRNTYVYNKAMSNYLARLEHQPELNAAMTDMHDQARNDSGKANSFGRMSVYNEISKRVNGYDPTTGDTGKLAPVMKRVMQMSFLDKMLSPAHSVVHMVQPAMLNFPLIAGRHGVGAAARAMSKAYGDIGALSTFAEGIKNTVTHIRDAKSTKGSEFMSSILAKAKSSNERAMLQHLIDHGTIDPDAGFELSHMISDSDGVVGALDKTINYFDGIARPFPRAVEAVNRSATALAAYRLEMAKTNDHAASMQYAQETVNMAEGVYNNANAAPLFNHPLARISLQFKKYGQMVYGLIGHEIGRAIHNANPGDRAEAIKTLGTMAAMHIAVAGVLGLPTEPFKWLLMGANLAGVTDYKWADVENWERQVLSSIAGKGVGEVLAHGFTRALPGGLAFDVTHRLGLSELMTFGEPASGSAADMNSYLGELIGGAPLGLALDYIKGSQAIAAGDYGKAAGLMVPIKAAADAIGAYQKLTEGKMSKSGNQTMEPYSVQEALVRTFGFTPARESENGDLQNVVYEQTKRAADNRTELQQRWYKATPAERMGLWGEVEKWNAGQPPVNKLTRAHLSDYVAKRRQDITDGRVTNGLLVTPKNRNIMASASRTYNN